MNAPAGSANSMGSVPMPSKAIASLSLDLDNQWSYMKTHGDPGWESFPSYLETVVPRALTFLEERDLIITFFVVGQDAALAANAEVLQSIGGAGHEIGNHSFHHEPWLSSRSQAQIEAELAEAEEHIERVTGQRPRGFRGPGYCCSAAQLRALARRGYLYDASTLPTYLGPLARLYYFATSKLGRAERQQRHRLFGTWREGRRPLHAYWWSLCGNDGCAATLLEIPVTTVPFVRTPFHASYLLYLALVSQSAAITYLRIALALCKATATQPSLLLHPLDFLDSRDCPDLAFFPAMSLPREKKMEVLDRIVHVLTSSYSVRTVRQHACEVASFQGLRTFEAH